MLISTGEALIHFCKQYDSLICYGTGDFAGKIYLYLEFWGIKIKKFCVSSLDDAVEKDFLHRPVIEADELIYEPEYSRKKLGIVIAVNEKHHNDIEENLKKINIQDVFKITQKFIDEEFTANKPVADKALLNLVKYNSLHINIKNRDEAAYQQRMAELKRRFNSIEIRYLSGTVGSCIAELLYYKDVYEKEKHHKFVLLYIRNSESAFHKEFKEPNEFLLEKFRGTGYEALTAGNMLFWQYFINSSPQFFQADASDFLMETIIPQQAVAIKEGSLANHRKQYINFSAEELSDRSKFLQQLNKEFVCFFAREYKYYHEVFKANDPLISIMDEYRNSDIDKFSEMTAYFNRKKIMCVRMGSVVHKKCQANNVYDYASKDRTPAGDFYLNSQCRFFIGDSSGAGSFASLFARPTVIINLFALTACRDVPIPLTPERDLLIFQKYWDKEKKRYLTFKEMLKFEQQAFLAPSKSSKTKNIFAIYHQRGIIPVKNTGKEILDVAVEMDDKLNGQQEYDGIDEYLQRKYRSILSESIDNADEYLWWYDARIGAVFLRENQWLLE